MLINEQELHRRLAITFWAQLCPVSVRDNLTSNKLPRKTLSVPLIAYSRDIAISIVTAFSKPVSLHALHDPFYDWSSLRSTSLTHSPSLLNPCSLQLLENVYVFHTIDFLGDFSLWLLIPLKFVARWNRYTVATQPSLQHGTLVGTQWTSPCLKSVGQSTRI